MAWHHFLRKQGSCSYLHTHVHSSIFHDTQKVGKNLNAHWWMNGQSVVHPRDKKVFSLKKEGRTFLVVVDENLPASARGRGFDP